MKTVTFPDGSTVPAIGQGTWHMGRDSSSRKAEADALRYGLDHGLTLIDTAEMYHDAELVVADALKGRRDEAYVVSKVLPSNASKRGTITACERSLKRLQMDCLDNYLLHWSSPHPIEETLEAFEALVEQGKIRSYGVSNLDIDELSAAWQAPGGNKISTNQLYYNLHNRGIEWDMLPWCSEHDMPIMAYSPLNQGNMSPDAIDQVAMRHNVNSFQAALAWVIRKPNVIAIPKAADFHHIDQNVVAASVTLTDEELKQIDRTYPPPGGPSPLQII